MQLFTYLVHRGCSSFSVWLRGEAAFCSIWSDSDISVVWFCDTVSTAYFDLRNDVLGPTEDKKVYCKFKVMHI